MHSTRSATFIATTCVFPLLFNGCKEKAPQAKEKKHPNIVIIYLDDLGYGDIGAYGATALKTPNIDFLASNGIRFTRGYASSATSSPSRYALLTGRYPWRNEEARILSGMAPLIIDTARITLPKMLKEEGYRTGIVGKWHLGLGDGNCDWNGHITPGPNEVGFDYSYILAATQDRVPTVYIENGYVDGLDPDDPISVSYTENFPGEPTALDHPEMLSMKWHHGHNNSIVNGIPRIGFMKGGKAALWDDYTMADHFLERATRFVKENKDTSFFLYYAMQEPHVPRTPNPRFQGSTGMGPRGDAIVEADWCVGQFIKLLGEENLLENTLIIFSSDNGPVLNDGYYDDAVEKLGDHRPAGPLRGGKYSLFEAGTRVPFIVYWKGTIQPAVSDAMVCQMDLLSSLAQLVGSDVRGEDSEPMLPVFLGQRDQGRESLVLEATGRTAYRKGEWVLIPPYNGPAVNPLVNIELGNSDEVQLYQLGDDIGQQENLAATHPEKLKELQEEFTRIRGEVNTREEQVLDLK